MFVVCQGRVAVTIGSGKEVARIEAGGFFGEMSLLTGEPRSATVSARGDCRVLEIAGDVFKRYVTEHPDVIDDVAGAAAARRRELDQSRGASDRESGRGPRDAGGANAPVLRSLEPEPVEQPAPAGAAVVAAAVVVATLVAES